MFVTFEGPEGGGKTTVIANVAADLRGDGREVVCTREPGSGDAGKKIREILLTGGHLDPKCELFLFLADRAEHVAKVIRPALQRGAWVLCDRFADSTIVYQGYGRGLDLGQLREWNRFATGNLAPDLTILMDIDPAAGLARIGSKDRLDSEPIEFHQRIRAGFLSEAQLEPDRWAIVDASQPAAASSDRVRALLVDRARSLDRKPVA